MMWCNQEYIMSGWNLNNLPVIGTSVLQYIDANISGMKVSLLCWPVSLSLFVSVVINLPLLCHCYLIFHADSIIRILQCLRLYVPVYLCYSLSLFLSLSVSK